MALGQEVIGKEQEQEQEQEQGWTLEIPHAKMMIFILF
jgi:hypothetical protein